MNPYKVANNQLTKYGFLIKIVALDSSLLAYVLTRLLIKGHWVRCRTLSM